MSPEAVIALAATVSAVATIAIAIIGALYTLYTRRLWGETRRQAATATRQAETAQQMLEAAHRPWLSIDLYADAGTGPNVINWASVIHNHGTVPATLTKATARVKWEGEVHAQGEQLQPKQVPEQLCVFPDREGELTWGVGNVSHAPWPKSGFFRIEVEVTYQGAFKDQTYTTRLEANYPRPEGSLSQRANSPMRVVRAEAT